MNLSEDHMPFEKCIDILESELGDHKPLEPYAGAHLAQALRISVELLKKEIPQKPKKNRTMRYGMGNAYADWICPECYTFLAYEPSPYNIPTRCPRCNQKLER